MSKDISRRAFLEDAGKIGLGAALAGHLPTIVPRHVLGGKGFTPPSALLNIAVVGVGGQGSGNGRAVGSDNPRAFCDVDLPFAERNVMGADRPNQPPSPETVSYLEKFKKANK